jgi:translation elongation factor EF-Tu-like GTPase
MTMPPMGFEEPQRWMVIQDVFHIKGRGAVVTGQLEGNVPLSAGDTLVCDGQSWQIQSIEQFRSVQQTVLPGSNIGILLRSGPDPHGLRGRTVQFEASSDRADQRKQRRWRG